MEKRLVSIIIPAYNAEKHLNECIDSVLGQTFEQIEVIIVDDGSTDNTFEVINHYKTLDSRVHVVHQANQGQGTARNTGMELACGDAVMFLDSDDYYMPDLAEVVYSILENKQCDIVIFNGNTFWDDDVAIKSGKDKYFSLGPGDSDVVRTGIDYLKLTKGRIQSPCLKIYNRGFLESNNIRFLDGGFGEDTYFFYDAFILAKRVCYADYIGYSRRYRTGSTMTSSGTLNIESRIKHFPSLLSLLGKVDNSEHKSIVMMQYVYYACLLWIMIHNRRSSPERRELKALYSENSLDRIVTENCSDLVTRVFSVLISLPDNADILKVAFSKTAKGILRGKTRFAI